MCIISKCQGHSGNTIGMTRKKTKDKQMMIGRYVQNGGKNNSREKKITHMKGLENGWLMDMFQ